MTPRPVTQVKVHSCPTLHHPPSRKHSRSSRPMLPPGLPARAQVSYLRRRRSLSSSLQKVRLRGDSLRAARSEAKRAKYHGTWAAAKRIGPCGPASGGLATLVYEMRAFRAVVPDRPGPHWKEGRWTHTATGAGGTHIRVVNLYGWPQGTLDLWKNQNTFLEGDVQPRRRPGRRPLGHGGGLECDPRRAMGACACPTHLRLAPRRRGKEAHLLSRPGESPRRMIFPR